MKPEKVEEAVDRNIINFLSSGKGLIDVYYMLGEKIEKFSKKDFFLDVTKSYIIFNWDSIKIRSKYSSYYVICSKKRKSDIMWLLSNEKFKSSFKNLSDYQLFKLLKLKEKLR